MFLRRSEPILLTEEGIDGLCPSLNRPVVELEGLPAGPARSAIVLYSDDLGQQGLLVTVRSEDSGASTLFEFQGEVSGQAHQVLDLGLTFAEGMGFLFDEDMLASPDPGGRRRALEIWCELTGDEAPAASAQPGGPPPGDLLLDDLVEALEGDLGEELTLEPLDALESRITAAAEAVPEVEDEPARPQAQVLSKFRRPDPAADANANSGAELARIPILKRRRTAADGPETPPLLARLLARF